MTTDQTETSDHEQRLGAALADCLEAMDDGLAPDRAELLARHPEFAAELARFLDDQERVERCARPLRAAAQGGAGTSLAAQSHLGDFRIVREVGRGGMGVVYEAEQVSLHRRVALKVLPFAAAMDPRALQRFRNEALAAACLHHTNIVPVFAVGCERGVSFYAMQFIDGTTLADVIRELRRPAGEAHAPAGAVPDERTTAHAPADKVADPKADTEPAARQSTLATQSGVRGREFFRRAAGWGVQAAEALDHAHQAAIVHRDVKPGNLLLDGRGQLWVADFGLAHVRQGEAGLTMTGDLIGTLRYMSPEQAFAKRVAIDHRTDVYSLGATLYELLTLHPALTGNDRQELLRQIAFEEPTPPRRLNKAIPPELEVIVLKAMEKNPADRYGTAQEMADDLRRFLDDKPIRARRPSWRQVAAKWARRHRSLVGAALAVLIVTLVGLAVSTALLAHQEEVTRAAYAEEARQRGRADLRDRQARQMVDDAYTQLAVQWLEYQPQMEEVQRDFLEKALRYYEEFAREGAGDPALQRELGVAYRRMGDMYYKLGLFDSARDSYGRSVDTLRSMPTDRADTAAGRGEMAVSGMQRGFLLYVTGHAPEAKEATEEAIRVFRSLVQESPAAADNRRSLVHCFNNLASFQEALGKPDDAVAAYQEAIGLGKQLVEDFPAQHASRDELARSCLDFGELLLAHGRRPEAEALLRESLRLRKELVAEYPEMPVYKRQLTRSLLGLGDWMRASKRSQESEEFCQAARTTAERLVESFPHVPEYRSELARACAGLARLRMDRFDWKAAALLMQQAADHQRLVAAGSPGHFYIQAQYRDHRLSLILLLARLGEHQQAAGLAEELLPEVIPDSKTDVVELNFLRRCIQLANQDARLDAAERERLVQGHVLRMRQILKGAAQPTDDPNNLNGLAWFLATTSCPEFYDPQRAVELARKAVAHATDNAADWNTLGVALYRAGDWDASRDALRKSMDLGNGGDSLDFFFLAMADWQLDERDKAKEWYKKAIAWMDKNKPQDEELLCFRAEAATLLGVQDTPPPKGTEKTPRKD